ncbi:Cof-type HAD-IIB family hydrolase [Enterococcus songbeiensis]
MSNEIKLIISDIDGTLLTSQHLLTKNLVQTLQEIQALSIPFIAASARSPRGILPIAQKLGIQNNPLAAYNGALITTDGNPPLFSHPLPAAGKKLLKLIKKFFPTISLNVYSNADWYTDSHNKWIEIEATITKMQPIFLSFADLLRQDPIHKLLLIGDAVEITTLMNFLNTQELTDCAFYLSKENYLEITHKQVSKETVLHEMANFYAVPLQNVLTIGDNYNDLPMLKAAGLGIAMGNAPAPVKESADKVTATNDQDGVAKALKKYVLDSP